MVYARTAAFVLLVALVSALLSSGLGKPEPASAHAGCANYIDETDLRNDPDTCRSTFIFDPGRSNFIPRSTIESGPLRNFLISTAGFSDNFLWYAPPTTITFPAGDPRQWSGCNFVNALFTNQVCSRAVSFHGVSAIFGNHAVTLNVWAFGGSFISMVCSNYSPGPQAVPVPTVSGTKFNDRNGNGSRDPGEEGLSGWTVRLHDPDGNSISTTTDGNGNYSFDVHTRPGNYFVTEDGQAGWVQSTGPGTFNIGEGVGNQNFGNNNFGNYQLASVSGHKFEDMNANGPDISDPPVPNWPITLIGHDGKGNPVTAGPILTDGSGNYTFSNLPPGAYELSEGSQPGWAQSYPVPVPPGVHDINLSSGENKTGQDFGNYRFASVAGRKYEDMNADGDDEAGNDPGVPNWVLHLDGVDGIGNPVHQTATTDVSGDYLFDTLTPGNYTVTEDVQPTWTARQGLGGYPESPVSGQNITYVDFGNWRHATPFGEKYDDLNGNGVRDAGEPGLPNWEIHLDGTDAYGAVVNRVTNTDAGGNYSFPNVVPGSYTTSEVMKVDADWVQTAPSPLGNCPIVPVSNQSGPQCTFGNLVRAEVHGMKFDDMNENGLKDGGDAGLSGWQITLTGVDGLGRSVSLSTMTAADGSYSFIGIHPGAHYLVCEINPDPTRWFQTAPASGIDGQCWGLQLQSHDVLQNIDFGNYDRSSIAGTKWFDHSKNRTRDLPGDEGLDGWTITLTDCNGDVIPQAAANQPTQPGETYDANPQVTHNAGQYSFTGLHNGHYCVNETMQPTWIQTVPCLYSAPCGYEYGDMPSGSHINDQDFGNFRSGNQKVPEGNSNNVDQSIPAANLYLCTTGPCSGPGEGDLRVVEHSINVHTGDENGDTIEDGLGAYEFSVEYDNFVIQSVNPCDIVFGPGGAGATRGPVDEVDASSPANADCSPDPNAANNGTCTMSLVLENVIHFGCTTNGQVPGPTGDFDLASFDLIPHPDLVNDIFPGNNNGVVTVLKDNGCELVDVFGHAITGSINGGLTQVCGDLAVTVRILEGDMNLDCKVDVQDEQLIGYRYGSFFGSALYSKWYDLEPALHDLDVDVKDLQKVFGRDGSTCQNPVPAQPPQPPPAPFG